jgi:hypothetical protein
MTLGEVSEWPKETVSKTVVGVSPPWVRIPPSPPDYPLKKGISAVLVRAPAQAGHRFLSKLDSDSCPNWTPIPAQAGHVRA